MTISLNGTQGTTTPGLYSNSTFTGTYADGIVVDYTSTLGRISVGTSDGLAFYNGGVASTELMRIDSSGNVGIGTSTINAQLQFSNSVGSAGIANKIRLYDGSGTAVFGFGISSGQLNYNCGDGAHVFSTGGGTPAERMRIDSSGNVLVGTTSALAKLTVNAGAYVGADISNTNTNDLIAVWGNKGGSASAMYILPIRVGGASLVGSIYYNGSAVAYNTSSDYRLKENIAPMTGALDTVAKLKPVTYNWKADGSDGQGFIAHELQEVVPDCVTGEKDAVDEEGNPVYQGIDTSFLVATLTAAIQEQQAIITQLQADVAALKGKVNV